MLRIRGRKSGFPLSREQERGLKGMVGAITPISIFPHQGGRGKLTLLGGLCKGLRQGGREKKRWIPACAGMTVGVAGMTEGDARPFDRLRVSGGWNGLRVSGGR